jgi:recombination protein RecT
MAAQLARRTASQPASTALAPPGGSDSIGALLSRPEIKQQVSLALPRHLTPDRLLRIALTEIRKTPKLADCSQQSLLAAIFSCAQLGLEPGGSLGHAYLVPYGRDVQFQLGYRGMIELARRSGQVESIEAHAVYEGDEFTAAFGLRSDLQHVPNWDDPTRTEDGKLLFAYAVAHLKGSDRPQFEVMSRAEIDAIRKRSRSGGSGPWQTDFAAMALKTVTRRLFKWLPVSIELSQAVTLDEAADKGWRQESEIDHLLDPVEAVTVTEPTEPAPTINAAQLEQIKTAISRRLTPDGVTAFNKQLTAAGIESIEELPAEWFDNLMGNLANAVACKRWNDGQHSQTGEAL